MKGSWISVHAAEGLITIGKGEVVLAALSCRRQRRPLRRVSNRRVANPGQMLCRQHRTTTSSIVERIRNRDARSHFDRPNARDRKRRHKLVSAADDERRRTPPGETDRVWPEQCCSCLRLSASRKPIRAAGPLRLVELLGASTRICRCRAGDILPHFQPLHRHSSNAPRMENGIEEGAAGFQCAATST